jgi:hypothetical protein
MSEIEWYPIPGWEDYYQVSIHGEVRSLDRVTTKGQRLKGKVKAPNVMPNGYLMVGLYRGSQRTAHTIHRLVMESIHGPCPDGYEVCHKNGKRDDNRLANLYYGTRSENNLDKRLHGTDHNASKTHCMHGHPFDADNTYWRPEGGRACKRCRRIRYARKTAIRRAAA